MITVREFVEADTGVTAQIFFNAVRSGTGRYYDETQRRAWAQRVPDPKEWSARLQSQCTFVAELEAAPVGFMTIDGDGHIDLAFVAPEQMGKGVADALYAAVEARALQLGIGKLDTAASHLARRFFERHGWSVIKQQTVVLGEVELTNFLMEKSLDWQLATRR